MKFTLKAVLSFYTGRLYSTTETPTALMGPLASFFKGSTATTIELPFLRERFKKILLEVCPPIIQTILSSWEHHEDWVNTISQLEKEYGEDVELEARWYSRVLVDGIIDTLFVKNEESVLAAVSYWPSGEVKSEGFNFKTPFIKDMSVPYLPKN